MSVEARRVNNPFRISFLFSRQPGVETVVLFVVVVRSFILLQLVGPRTHKTKLAVAGLSKRRAHTIHRHGKPGPHCQANIAAVHSFGHCLVCWSSSRQVRVYTYQYIYVRIRSYLYAHIYILPNSMVPAVRLKRNVRFILFFLPSCVNFCPGSVRILSGTKNLLQSTYETIVCHAFFAVFTVKFVIRRRRRQ